MSNILLNAGSGGATLGTDQVAGTPNVDYQIVKIGFSAAGSTPVQVQTGNPLPTVQTGALPAGANTIGGVNLAQYTPSSGRLPVDGSGVTQPVSGTVTANIGTSGSLALDASVTGLQVGQGSTTSGQKGGLALGAVTTGAPTYVTAQSSPLSLTTAGALRVDNSAVTQPVSGTVTANAGSGTFNIQANASVNLAQIAGTTTLTGNGTAGAGAQRVTIASDNTAFSVNAVQSGTWTVQPGNTANTTPWLVTLVPGSQGWSKWSTPKNNSNTALTNTVVSVHSSAAGEFGGYIVYNPNASVAYVQVFDVATAGGVTLGTTRPDMVIPVPATSGANLEFANGVNFANGIQIAATTTDSGLTAPGSGLTVTIVYK